MCSLDLCHLDFLSDPPSCVEAYTVANEQGGIRGELIGGTNKQAIARSSTRFSASVADAIEEQELQDGSALRLS